MNSVLIDFFSKVTFHGSLNLCRAIQLMVKLILVVLTRSHTISHHISYSCIPKTELYIFQPRKVTLNERTRAPKCIFTVLLRSFYNTTVYSVYCEYHTVRRYLKSPFTCYILTVYSEWGCQCICRTKWACIESQKAHLKFECRYFQFLFRSESRQPTAN